MHSIDNQLFDLKALVFEGYGTAAAKRGQHGHDYTNSITDINMGQRLLQQQRQLRQLIPRQQRYIEGSIIRRYSVGLPNAHRLDTTYINLSDISTHTRTSIYVSTIEPTPAIREFHGKINENKQNKSSGGGANGGCFQDSAICEMKYAQGV